MITKAQISCTANRSAFIFNMWTVQILFFSNLIFRDSSQRHSLTRSVSVENLIDRFSYDTACSVMRKPVLWQVQGHQVLTGWKSYVKKDAAYKKDLNQLCLAKLVTCNQFFS